MIDALSYFWDQGNKKKIEAKRRLSWALIFLLVLLGLQNRANAMARNPTAPLPTVTTIPSSSPKPSVSPSPTPTTSPSPAPSQMPSSGIYREKIMEIASTSACAKVSWKNRGRAPAAYMKGMALSFARGLCRQQKELGFKNAPGALMSRASSGNSAKDALAHYSDVLANAGMPAVNQSGPDTLRVLFTLGIGLGMRESSGKYCVGYDTTASSHTANSSEAGLFQASYDSIGATPELKELYQEYQANPQRCHLDIFKQGVSCTNQGIIGAGTAGGDYQAFNKQCPAFAAEYAMTLIRVLRSHFGPINRKEAEVIPACEVMLGDIENFVIGDRARVCGDLN